MKFINRVTGNTLETKNEKAIALMKGNPDRYEAVTGAVKEAKAKKKADKKAEDKAEEATEAVD